MHLARIARAGIACGHIQLRPPSETCTRLKLQGGVYTKLLRSTLILTLSVFSIGLVAHAQATRTWVSGVGDDANPCSRTAPCKTWAGAISKTAVGGEIDALDPGGFGGVTITNSITLDGGGGQVASILVSGTNGITISASTGSVVTLRNLRFQGLAQTAFGGLTGISFIAGSVLHIEKCAIYGFTQNGIGVNLPNGGQVYIDDTTSQDNTGGGLSVVGTTGGTAGEVHVSISNSHFSNNAVGVFAGDSGAVDIRTSDANGNTGAGFQAEATTNPTIMNIADSMAANNLGAGVSAGGGTAAAKARVSNVSLFGNGSGFQTGTLGTIQSWGNNSNPGTGTPTSKIALQ